MSEVPDKQELIVTGPTPKDELTQPERPVLSVALGNVVLTEHGAEVTLVFPKEVVFADEDLNAQLEKQGEDAKP